MVSSRKTPTLCERDIWQLWGTHLIHPLARDGMIALIVTRKGGDARYYFALWQTNNNTPNKLLLSESAVSCLLRVRSVSFSKLVLIINIYEILDCKTIIYRQPLSMGYLIPRLVISLSKKSKNNSHRVLVLLSTFLNVHYS
jgi:hypothetical protein